MSAERYPVETLDENADDGTMPANVETLAEAVVGHRIVAVEGDAEIPKAGHYYWGSERGLALTLDNGKRVFLGDTSDCCAYTELISVIKHLDQIDHIITGVGTTDGYTKWHVFADLGDVLELEVGWSAGNPFYYGYGFDITVVEAGDPS